MIQGPPRLTWTETLLPYTKLFRSGKCGPKTAAKGLGEHGTLDGVIAAAPGIKGKIGENLRGALERLPLNRDLVTIKTDVVLDGGPETLALRERATDKPRELFTRSAMSQALSDLDGGAAAVPAAQASKPPRGASFEIGRASCRARVCQYVYISVVARP